MRIVSVLMPMFLLGALCDCGSNNSKNVGGAPSGTSADSLAAQQGSNAANEAGSSDAVGSSQAPSAMFFWELSERLSQVSATASFKVGGCTGQVAYTTDVTTTGVTITGTDIFSASGCSGDIKLSGAQNIVITANLANTDRTTQVSGSLIQTMDGGDKTVIESLDPSVAYLYKLVASGTQASGDVNVMVSLNEHRVRSNDSTTVFDHNVTTPATAGVQVVAAYNSDGSAKSRTIASGEVDVHHNVAKFIAKHTYNNLSYDTTGDCACPSSGSITQVVTSDANDWTYTRTYAFTGCGQATVITSDSTKSDTGNGTATISWDDCSN